MYSLSARALFSRFCRAAWNDVASVSGIRETPRAISTISLHHHRNHRAGGGVVSAYFCRFCDDHIRKPHRREALCDVARVVSRQSSFEARISRNCRSAVSRVSRRKQHFHSRVYIVCHCLPFAQETRPSLRPLRAPTANLLEDYTDYTEAAEMGFKLSSIMLVLLLELVTHGYSLYEDLYEGSECRLEDGDTGICKNISHCPHRIKEVMEGKRSADSAGRCGFVNDTEIVCCQLNITEKIGLRPAEIACRQYENEISSLLDKQVQYNIFNGTPADQGEFPYMVALGYTNQEDNDWGPIKYDCGGTLISSQHVLTAAHCVNNKDKRVPIEVRIGIADLKSKSNDGQRIAVKNVTSHPRYKRSVNYNDVAILELMTPVRLTNHVRPICILSKPLTTMDTSADVSFVVIGWGALNIDEDNTNILMKTPALRFVDRESCSKSFDDFGRLPRGLDESLLCAQDADKTRRSDACLGDSGGPLLMTQGPNYSIVGITAFGQACGNPTPGVYTAVYSYLDWIEGQVWPEISNEAR